MDNLNSEFNPNNIEEQIHHFMQQNPDHSPESKIIHNLHNLSQQDQKIISQARARIFHHMSNHSKTSQSIQKNSMKPVYPHQERGNTMRITTNSMRPLQTLAAILVIGVLITTTAISLWLFRQQPNTGSTPTPIPSPIIQPTNTPKPKQTFIYTTTMGTEPIVYKIDPNTGSKIWQYALDPSNYSIYSNSVVLTNNTLFFTASQIQGKEKEAKGKKIVTFALNAQNGTLINKLDGNYFSSSTTQNVVYLDFFQEETKSHFIQAINVQTKQKLWSTPVSIPNEEATQHGTFLFFTTFDNKILSLNTQDGSITWSAPYEGINAAKPIVNNNILYTVIDGQENSALYAYNATNGTPLWHTNIHPMNGITRLNPVLHKNVLYTSAYKNLYALDVTQQGKLLWSAEVDNDIVTPPTIVDDSMYLGIAKQINNAQADTFILALNRTNGVERWKQKSMVYAPFTPAPQVVANTLYYLGGPAIELHDISDGKLIKTLTVDNSTTYLNFLLVSQE